VGKEIEKLLDAESEAAEAAERSQDPSAPLPAQTKVARGHPRSRNLQVRFRDDEFEDLAQYAEQEGLPVSTVVRHLVLQAIQPAGDLQAALDRVESELSAIRRRVLSA
jgi:hypothetical protein